MDVTSIEATSVAIRAGQVAAAELANLLLHDDVEPAAPIEDWFDPQPRTLLNTEAVRAALRYHIEHGVDRLGGYVCHSADAVSGERLYRWAVLEGIAGRAEWADRPFGQRQAYEIFAAVVRQVYVRLKAEQARLEAKPAPVQTKLALEDSIFEPIGKMGELRKESVAAAPLIAAHDAGVAAEKEKAAAARRVLEQDVHEDTGRPLEELKLLTTPELEELLAGARPPAEEPLAIGEAPARHRGDRGGRRPKPVK